MLEKWAFPVFNCPGIPVNNHPGGYGHHRKHEVHSGVDLYTRNEEPVFACLDGIVTGITDFTGEKVGTPWWNDTQCVLVYSPDYNLTICYGEVSPNLDLKVGNKVKKYEKIANIIPVLKPERLRKDIEGHSTSMLHLELYTIKTISPSSSWFQGRTQLGMIDPTPYLIKAMGNKVTILTR